MTTSPFILIIYLYWYSYKVYFVCDSASEFGAMGSTPFEPHQFLFFSIRLTTTVTRSFVCDSASEFGAMGSTSFLGFSYPNLLLVFLNLLFFRNLFIYFIVLVSLYSIFCL